MNSNVLQVMISTRTNSPPLVTWEDCLDMPTGFGTEICLRGRVSWVTTNSSLLSLLSSDDSRGDWAGGLITVGLSIRGYLTSVYLFLWKCFILPMLTTFSMVITKWSMNLALQGEYKWSSRCYICNLSKPECILFRYYCFRAFDSRIKKKVRIV